MEHYFSISRNFRKTLIILIQRECSSSLIHLIMPILISLSGQAVKEIALVFKLCFDYGK
jgi:hypothetical protein